MKPEELMIGDWVNFLIDIEGGDTENDPQNEVYQPMQVNTIASWEVGGEVESREGEINDPEQLLPIAITAEILEKNGFGYKEEDDYLTHYYLGDGWYLDNPDLHIGTYNKGVYWLNYCDNAICGIKYIHELQHALRLCGINKEIIL